jgi:AcrR family transcriptional regulator
MSQDLETRQRLLDAAARLFADRGFRKVTVREICGAARANVAAVNYHFGDKLGLYREVLQLAIQTMRETTEAGRLAGVGLPPEEKLRRFFQVTMERISRDRKREWIHKLIKRETSDPTPALDTLVEQGMQPRLDYLGTVVAEMIGVPRDSPEVRRSVVCIQALWMLFVPNPISTRLGSAYRITADEVQQIAADIAEFSVAGVRAIACQQKEQGV